LLEAHARQLAIATVQDRLHVGKEEAPHDERRAAARNHERTQQAHQGRAQGDLVGSKRQATEQMARDEEGHRLVEVARDETQIATQQLSEDGALRVAAAGLVDDAHDAFQRATSRAHLVGAHLDSARKLPAQSRQGLGLGHLVYLHRGRQVGGQAAASVSGQLHVVLQAVQLLMARSENRQAGPRASTKPTTSARVARSNTGACQAWARPRWARLACWFGRRGSRGRSVLHGRRRQGQENIPGPICAWNHSDSWETRRTC